MLKIGLFSKLSRVSIRMLRYYDEIGLLHPAYIDPESDYRYYREDQLPQIGWITALRDMGFSLEDVCRIMAVGRDAEALAPFFAQRRRELEQEANWPDTDHQGYVTLFASSLPELDVFDRDMQNKAKNWHMKLNPMKGQQRAALTTILPLGI